RRLAMNASRAARSRKRIEPRASGLAPAASDLARCGRNRITTSAAASSRPPAAAKRHGEKCLDKAKTPLRHASSSHSTPRVHMSQLHNEYLADYLFSIALSYLSILLPMTGSTWRWRCAAD